MLINSVTQLEVADTVAIITINSPPVNALSEGVREGLHTGISIALGDGAAKAIVILCAGDTFIAGADIKELGKPKHPPTLADIQSLMENASKPIISAIHGSALGGGLELALCAHYRVATTSALLGLPEVKLGLLPGAGGTQRLPRLIGVELALNMMTFGQRMTAAEAFSIGLVDDLIIDDLKAGAIAFAKCLERQQRPLVRLRDDQRKLTLPNPDIFFSEFRRHHETAFSGYKAPEAIIRCVEAAVHKPWEEGIEIERQLFRELLTTPEAAALRYGFQAERQSRKTPAGFSSRPNLNGLRIADTGALVSRLIARAALSPAEPQIRVDTVDPTIEPLVVFETVAMTRPASEYILDLRAQVGDAATIIAAGTPESMEAFFHIAESDPMIMGYCIHKPMNDRSLVEVIYGLGISQSRLAAALGLARTFGSHPVLQRLGPALACSRMIARLVRTVRELAAGRFAVAHIKESLSTFGFPGELLGHIPVCESPPDQRPIDTEVIPALCASVLVDEAVRLIEEGQIARACEIDILAQAGLGWPPYRGGPMWYGDQLGVDTILTTLRRFEETQGRQYSVPTSLQEIRLGHGRLIHLAGGVNSGGTTEGMRP